VRPKTFSKEALRPFFLLLGLFQLFFQRRQKEPAPGERDCGDWEPNKLACGKLGATATCPLYANAFEIAVNAVMR